MSQPPPFSFLPDLKMPLRDALRGVASLVDATEEALEPAANLLPHSIRTRFRSALKSIEGAGRRLMTAPVDLEHIQMASDFVGGKATDKAALENCATVIGYAWEHLQSSGHSHRPLISETVLASRLFRSLSASGRSAADCAAFLIVDIRKSSAIGPMPGVIGSAGAEKRREIDLGLVSIMVWLLSARADNMTEEEKLLDLALALVSAIQVDALGAIEEPEKLAQVLESASTHL